MPAVELLHETRESASELLHVTNELLKLSMQARVKAVEFLQAERSAGRPVHEKRRGKQHRMIIKSRVQSLENPRHILHCLAVTNPLPIPYHQEGQVVSDYLVPRVTMCITSILDVSMPMR